MPRPPTETDGNGNWQRSNVYAAGALIATYDIPSPAGPALHFHLSDWLPGSPWTGPRPWGGLGTRRVQTDISGNPEQTCSSLPFGDALTCSDPSAAPPTADNANNLHFTGKERDTESGNDYFGARYYASSMGRFMSPDWSAKAEPVPYAKLGDPQSLNLYAYVRNNPLVRFDSDGHADWCAGTGISSLACSAQSAWNNLHGIASYAASTLYAKSEVGVGLGGEVKLGAAKLNLEAKDVTETRTARVSTRKEIIEVKASMKFGPVEVGLGITGEKPLQTDKEDAPADAKTEWTPLIAANYRSMSTDSHGWDTGFGGTGCLLLCLGAEGGIDAGKAASDATNYVKKTVDTMQSPTGTTY